MTFGSVLRRLFSRKGSPGPEDQDAIFRTVVEHSPDVICRLVNGRFTYVSPSAASTLGRDPKTLVGTDGLDLIFEEDRPIIARALAETIAGRKTRSTSQIRVICGDGSLKWVESTSHTRVRDGVEERVLNIRDITDRKRREEELAAFALQDGLTGLANRRSFDQTLDREWKRTLREGGQISLLLLDIDHFKQFNDAYGHQAGDDCLRAVAACVADHARPPSALACRYGGEEIAVILGGSDVDAATAMAEHIRSAIAALNIPHGASPCSERLTVSIGVAAAVARAGGTVLTPEGLLQAADHALYKAKAEGRNRSERSVLIAPSP
jgi:diguanylate cyclase (GGDEF)-like protein/PAS domain S-box-containing protein